MNDEQKSWVAWFARHRSTLGKYSLLFRGTALGLIVPFGLFLSDIDVVVAGLIVYTLGNEARNVHERLRPDNMMQSLTENMGDLFDD